jgi:predicted transcriptional regulator
MLKNWGSDSVGGFFTTEHGGKMERSRLRVKAAMRYSQMNPILDELVKKGRIRISGEIISTVNKT